MMSDMLLKDLRGRGRQKLRHRAYSALPYPLPLHPGHQEVLQPPSPCGGAQSQGSCANQLP